MILPKPRPPLNPQDYINSTKRDFAYYGFTECPLTDAQLSTLYDLQASRDETYGIGCDVHAGFPFSDAIRANMDRR